MSKKILPPLLALRSMMVLATACSVTEYPDHYEVECLGAPSDASVPYQPQSPTLVFTATLEPETEPLEASAINSRRGKFEIRFPHTEEDAGTP